MPTRGVTGEKDARQLLGPGRTAALGPGDPQGKGNAVVCVRGCSVELCYPLPAHLRQCPAAGSSMACRHAPPQHSPSFQPGRLGSMKDTSPCLPAQPQHSVCPYTGQGAARAPLAVQTPTLQDNGIRKAGSCQSCTETVSQLGQGTRSSRA